MTYQNAVRALRAHADPKKALVYRSYFKNSENDIFLGVTASTMRAIAREFIGLSFADLRKLKKSRIHDERSLAHAILVLRFNKADEIGRRKIFEFYIANRKQIRAWDGVDDSAPYIVGPYLLTRSKKILYQLARSSRLWDRRIAIVSTWWFIRQGEISETLKIARLLLHDKEDLIRKATGWMLREVGKRDKKALERFLDRHHPIMPRTTLRYAIERFPPNQRQKYLNARAQASG